MTTSHPDGVTLTDYADDQLAQAERADVAAHLASCAECRATVDALRDVAAAARTLPPLVPRREAWDRIERSLRATRVSKRVPTWSWLAAAAALVVATVAGLKVADLRRQRDTPAATTATPPLASEAPTAQSIAAELSLAEPHYQKALTDLEQMANAEKGALDPQTASTLEKNLTVIDQAISESRAALRAQPASEAAQASLVENFKSKIALLQDTIALISEMRRGSDTGAAGLAAGLKQKGK